MTLNPQEQLNHYFQQVQDIILSRQDWITGLLPASTAVNAHGNYTDAWVRDNVYSILAVWGLGLAYRRADIDTGRTYCLEQSTVKLMRGLLTAMMRQADKAEKFKQTQNPLDALHAKYDTKTGTAVVGDNEWGHLQLDATSLFLLMLAQMTASGLRIVFTINEVNFVQNLVHYISRTYRTPDYGIWERGHKINHGIAELNASSIGMAKAALEALSEFNLFGKDGGQASVIHVISDDIARTRITLESLLPRESISKEVDAAVLSVTGFPAFAVDDVKLKDKTEALICEKLEGRYGCKRFLRDGHQTAIEDPNRLYYEAHELKQFADIECEWPLFFSYLLLNHLFAGEKAKSEEYRNKLDQLLVEQNGQKLLPELYSVPKNLIAAEKAEPHSQKRVPNENIPLVWAQSLFMLGCLIQDELLEINDIDPLGRYQGDRRKPPEKIHFQLIAEDETVKQTLINEGIVSQTLEEISPVQIKEASELSKALTQVGRNDRIGLTGRPLRQMRTLTTSKIYTLAGKTLLFFPQCLNQQGFYLALDNRLLIHRLHTELAYVYQHWDRSETPLISMPIKHNMLYGHNRIFLLRFLDELKQNISNGIPVNIASLAECMSTVSHEKIDYLHDFQFSDPVVQRDENSLIHDLPLDESNQVPLDAQTSLTWSNAPDEYLKGLLQTETNLYARLEALTILKMRYGLQHPTGIQLASVGDLLENVYARAGNLHNWYIVRRCAGLLDKYDINLEQAASEILMRQHRLTLGRSYSGRATLAKPTDSSEILEKIKAFNTDPSEQIIIQEMILYLGMFIKSKPQLFDGMNTVRVGNILQLISVRQQREKGDISLDQAFEQVLFLSPFELSEKVKELFEDYGNAEMQLKQSEVLHFQGDSSHLTDVDFSTSAELDDIDDWYEWRERQGTVGRDDDHFFSNVWDILHRCKGLTIGDKLNSKNRLNSDTILSQMTSGEQSFKLYVSHLLNKIQAPMYRQLTVEALNAVSSIFRENTSLKIDDTLVVDILIGHAVRISWLQNHPESQHNYDQDVSFAWQRFYQLPPDQVSNSIGHALIHLLNHH